MQVYAHVTRRLQEDNVSEQGISSTRSSCLIDVPNTQMLGNAMRQRAPVRCSRLYTCGSDRTKFTHNQVLKREKDGLSLEAQRKNL
eukprot:4303862-Amphidinium_carterae.1